MFDHSAWAILVYTMYPPFLDNTQGYMICNFCDLGQLHRAEKRDDRAVFLQAVQLYRKASRHTEAWLSPNALRLETVLQFFYSGF